MIAAPAKERTKEDDQIPRCKDFDEDCDRVRDKLHCYLYDPGKGYCPYLRSSTEKA